MNKLTGVSLFSSAGIAEYYFKRCGIDIVLATELVSKRCDLHEFLYPNCKMIQGDITDANVFNLVNEEIKKDKCNFLIATPPCQGMSSLGKKEYSTDKRNYLVFYILDIIEDNDFDYILIENVPKFLKLFFPYENGLFDLCSIINKKFGDRYSIDSHVLNAMNYGVPQSRPRGIIRMWKKGKKWDLPKESTPITLKEAIGDLPSLETGEDSGIKWHFAKHHNDREVLAMKHTPEGKSALKNAVYFPKKVNGEPIKGFHNTYTRMKWDEPCPARTMNSGNLGGHNNVHPGKLMPDGTYSDARVLTLRELFIVTSLPADIDLPNWCSDNFIRQMIGEAIPPRFAERIVEGINYDKTSKK